MMQKRAAISSKFFLNFNKLVKDQSILDFFGPSLSRTVQGTYSDNKMSGNLSIPHNNTFYFILSLTSTNKLHVLAYTENRTNLVFEEYLISNNNNH
jgi:hypothetical protein